MNEKELAQLVQSVVASVQGQKSERHFARVEDVTLETARRLISRVEQKAAEMGVKAVVAVSNRAARPVVVECMDDSYIASYDVALNKAFTVVSLKMSTSELKMLAQPGGSLYGIQHTNDGKIVIFGGGVPLRCEGKVIGGLGVSGGSEEQDTALAEYGGRVFEEELL